MSLTLTVLGGAAAWPNPGQGCSAYLVQSRDTNVLIDCGSDTLLELRRHVDYTRIDAIIISHWHSDHILDLIPYRYGLRYSPHRPASRVPLWLPPGGIDRLDMIAEAIAGSGEDIGGFFGDVFELGEFDPESDQPIGDLQLSFARTQHPIPCFAIRIQDREGHSIVYSSDTGAIDPLREFVRGSRIVIAEATMDSHHGKAVTERVHLTPEDAGQLATIAQARLLVLTHLWSERPDDQVIQEARRAFAGDVLVAKPGLRIDA